MILRLARLSRSGLTWLLAGLLGSCAVWAMGQDDSAEARMQEQTRHIQAGFKQVSNQLGQLRQITVQSDQTLLKQTQAVHKQIEGIVQGQARLGEQLAQLQAESQQQIERLQAANRHLTQALWGLGGLAVLVVLMAMVLGRRRALAAVPQGQPMGTTRSNAAAQPTQRVEPFEVPEMTASSSAAPDLSPAVPPSTPFRDPVPSPEPEATVTTTEPLSTMASPWAALVAADLSSTEQALAQARQGFMQPVRKEQ